MSAAVYISTERSSAADEIPVNGKYFILHIDNISAIGEDHGLKRIDEYISQTLEEFMEFAEASGLSSEQIGHSYKEEWFDPTEGRDLVEKYIELLRSYHSLSDTTKTQCLEELETYKSILEILAKEKIRWHFSYDI